MRQWMRQIVSFALVVAFGGAPAIAATCAALCGPGADHRMHAAAEADVASHDHDSADPTAATNIAPDAAASMHHHPLAASQAMQDADPIDAGTRLSALGDCCTKADVSLTASVAAARAIAGAPIAMAAVAPASFEAQAHPMQGALSSISFVQPSPTRAPLVLRI